MRQLLRILTLAALLAAGSQPARAHDGLYQALGATTGITRMVDLLVDSAVADERINADFLETNIPRLKGLLGVYICQLTGGPCEYKGRTMAKSHAPLHITTEQFNILVEHLQDAMDRCDIGFRTQNRLLAILAPMRAQIVTR